MKIISIVSSGFDRQHLAVVSLESTQHYLHYHMHYAISLTVCYIRLDLPNKKMTTATTQMMQQHGPIL